jgi:hypothetical protein
MFQYRAVLVRLRQGDTDREVARARLMGRHKTAALRALATERGWLNPCRDKWGQSELTLLLWYSFSWALCCEFTGMEDRLCDHSTCNRARWYEDS